MDGLQFPGVKPGQKCPRGKDLNTGPSRSIQQVSIAGDHDGSGGFGAAQELVVIRVNGDGVAGFRVRHESAATHEHCEYVSVFESRPGRAEPFTGPDILVIDPWGYDEFIAPGGPSVEDRARDPPKKIPETTTLVSRTAFTSRPGPPESPSQRLVARAPPPRLTRVLGPTGLRTH